MWAEDDADDVGYVVQMYKESMEGMRALFKDKESRK